MRVAQLVRAAPFPWHSFLRGAELASLDRLVVAEVTAIPKIAALYARTPVATLKAWQAFRLADAAAPYLSSASSLPVLNFATRPSTALPNSRRGGSAA